MIKDIENKVRQELDNKGFNLNYDPDNKRYTPWYRIPFKVEIVEGEKGNVGSAYLTKRKIRIPCKGYDDSIDKITGGLLHEAGHVDIFPAELPLIFLGFKYLPSLLSNFDSKNLIIMGIMAGYFLIGRELMVEGYNCLKHGAKKYLKLKYGKKEELKAPSLLFEEDD